MKVVIEVDIPDGWKIPSSDDVKRLSDPDWISDWWHISDVADQADVELTDEECREVLARVKKSHDANVGINWDVISYHADEVLDEREENLE
tara:strand:+ start:13104 stop:13376 length:273 start_codon:yes stop_codon:yes gene_type:complete